MKRTLSILFACAALFGQSQREREVTLETPPPPGVASVSVSRVGAAGNATYCYHVIPIYPVGKGAAQTGCITSAVSTLTVSNYIRVNWSPAVGATGYDIVRTTREQFPGSCTSCTVATNLNAVTVSDTGDALGTYSSFAAAPGAKETLTLNNRDYAEPTIEVQRPWRFNGSVNVNTTCPPGSPASACVSKVQIPTMKTMVTLGDSLTNNTTLGSRKSDKNSFATMLEQRSYGKFWNVNNAGVAGDTTALMLARIQADVIAFHPDICFVMGGTNDNITGVAPATTQTTLNSIADALLAAGIHPIFLTPLPNNSTHQADLQTLRASILAMPAKRNVEAIDVYTVLSPTGDVPNLTYQPDNIHTNTAGAILLADFLIARFGLAGVDPVGLPLTKTGLESWNLWPNGLFLNVPTSPTPYWATLFPAANAQASYATALYGNSFVYTLGTTAARYLWGTNIPIIPGHRYSIAARVEVTGALDYEVYGQYDTSPNTSMYAAGNSWTMTLAPYTVVHAEMVAPDTAGNLSFGVAVNSGVGTIKISQVTVRDVTVNPVRSVSIVDTSGNAEVPGALKVAGNAANGQLFNVQTLSEVTTIAAAATSATTIQIPASVVVLGVSVRVTTVIPTATTFTVTGTGSSTVFNTAAVAVAAGSTDPGTAAGAYYNATAQTITITPNGTPAANTGRVRVTIHYYTITPPSS